MGALGLGHLLEDLPEAWGPDHLVDLLVALDLDRLLEALVERLVALDLDHLVDLLVALVERLEALDLDHLLEGLPEAWARDLSLIHLVRCRRDLLLEASGAPLPALHLDHLLDLFVAAAQRVHARAPAPLPPRSPDATPTHPPTTHL